MKHISYDDIYDAIKLYEDELKKSFKPTVSKVPTGYVFDEEKSVRWNREQVDERNKAYTSERNRFYEERSKLFEDIHYKEISRIVQSLHVSDPCAERIWDFVRNHKDSLYECLDFTEDLIDLLKDIVKEINHEK